MYSSFAVPGPPFVADMRMLPIRRSWLIATASWQVWLARLFVDRVPLPPRTAFTASVPASDCAPRSPTRVRVLWLEGRGWQFEVIARGFVMRLRRSRPRAARVAARSLPTKNHRRLQDAHSERAAQRFRIARSATARLITQPAPIRRSWVNSLGLPATISPTISVSICVAAPSPIA
jgi:hypothetical protein